MAHQLNGLFPRSLLKAFSFLIFIILLKDACHGQPQLIGPSQALVARAGDDVILPCHVEPAYDVSTKTLEWTRSSLDPRFVYVSRANQELEKLKNPFFKGRTSVFVDELKNGNISLKISKVQSEDTGIYRCYVPVLEKEAFVELVVGQPQLIGPSQALVARAGDDVILPCHVEPAYDVSTKTLEWTRSSLDPRFVYVSRASQELEKLKNPSFKGRTSMFVDELKNGNISLKISKVKFDDSGIYKCYIPDLEKEAFVELVVAPDATTSSVISLSGINNTRGGVVLQSSDAATSPVISLSGIDKNRGGVVLQCESAGWYPEPELLWLDGEGKLLSAGPTETLRGPDDLYTVSSRVTVEKRHSNSITCRVQQRNTNQSRETHIYVPEDFFAIPSSSSAVIIGLAVSLALCIMLLILSAVVLFRRKREHMMKNNRRTRDHPDSGDAEIYLKKTEGEKLNLSSSSTKTKKQTSCMLQADKKRNEETDRKLKALVKMLEDEKKKTEEKLNELAKMLEDEKKKTEENLKEEFHSSRQATAAPSYRGRIYYQSH